MNMRWIFKLVNAIHFLLGAFPYARGSSVRIAISSV